MHQTNQLYSQSQEQLGEEVLLK